MHRCLSVVGSVYICNDTKKNDIGSTVDLVDDVLWHMMARMAKRKNNNNNNNPVEEQSGVQWFVFVSSPCCATVVSVDWGSSLVNQQKWNIKIYACLRSSYPASLLWFQGQTDGLRQLGFNWQEAEGHGNKHPYNILYSQSGFRAVWPQLRESRDTQGRRRLASWFVSKMKLSSLCLYFFLGGFDFHCHPYSKQKKQKKNCFGTIFLWGWWSSHLSGTVQACRSRGRRGFCAPLPRCV